MSSRPRIFNHPPLDRVYQDLRRRDPKPGELSDGPVARAFAAGRAGAPLASCWHGRYAWAAWAAGHDLSVLAETPVRQRARRWEARQQNNIAYAGRERVGSSSLTARAPRGDDT